MRDRNLLGCGYHTNTEEIPVRAERLVQHCLGSCLELIHAARAACLVAVIAALLRRGRLMPAQLGRALGGPAAAKHKIKRVDRLLRNRHLQSEVTSVVGALARRLLAGVRQPVILVDWTELSANMVALVASVPLGGRAQPIYFEPHPLSLLSNPKVERRFLRCLARDIVPAECKPIVVTDAGFKGPWFKAVTELGWDFIGRLSAGTKVSDVIDEGQVEPRSSRWTRVRRLFIGATSKPEDLGARIVAPSNPMVSRVVRIKQPPAGRHGSKKVNRKGVHPGSTVYKKYQRRAHDPWVLVTSLGKASAAAIVGRYALRMQTEESFRDLKNHRFGWSFEDVSSRDLERLRVILLVAALAMAVQTLVGVVAESQNIHRRFQANTVRTRRVLSFFVLGGQLLASEHDHGVLAQVRRGPFAFLRARVAIYAGSEQPPVGEIRGDP